MPLVFGSRLVCAVALGGEEFGKGDLVDCFFVGSVVTEAFSGARVEVVGGGSGVCRGVVGGGIEDPVGEVRFWRAPSWEGYVVGVRGLEVL